MSGMSQPSPDTESPKLDDMAAEARGDLCYYGEPHHWSSHHMPRCPIWVSICTQCRAIDGDDLNAQIAHIAVKAADNERRETELKAERDRFVEHSKTLNTVCWKLARALGDVADGADHVFSDEPLVLADRVVDQLDKLRAELANVQPIIDTCRAQDEQYRDAVVRAERAELVIKRARRELNARLPELDSEVPA